MKSATEGKKNRIMMTRLWKPTRDYDKGTWARVEEHKFNDGSLHYSFRDRSGHPMNVDNLEEALKIVKKWAMEEVQL